MSGTLRIGVAGAGLIGRKHIELIAASPDCVLAGIADPSPEAKAFAEARHSQHPIDRGPLLRSDQRRGCRYRLVGHQLGSLFPNQNLTPTIGYPGRRAPADEQQ